jgi:hypothetical protein
MSRAMVKKNMSLGISEEGGTTNPIEHVIIIPKLRVDSSISYASNEVL